MNLPGRKLTGSIRDLLALGRKKPRLPGWPASAIAPRALQSRARYEQRVHARPSAHGEARSGAPRGRACAGPCAQGGRSWGREPMQHLGGRHPIGSQRLRAWGARLQDSNMHRCACVCCSNVFLPPFSFRLSALGLHVAAPGHFVLPAMLG